MNSLVSVCIPTFNRSADLVKTLYDISRQSYTDYEILIGDDASTDDTPDVVARWDNPKIRYFRHPTNLGIYGNWNHLIQQSRGDFVCIYHDHDVYLPTILERSVQALRKSSSVQFVHTALLMVDQEFSPVRLDVRPFSSSMDGNALRKFLADSPFSPVMAATAMVRRDAYEKVGLYDSNRFGLGCDKDMWFRLAALGSVAYIEQPQALIRTRERGQGTGRFSWKEFELHYSMQLAQAEEYYANQSARERAIADIQSRRRNELAKYFSRCVLMRESGNIAEGERLIQRYFSRAGLVASLIRSSFLRPLFHLGLQIHYYASRRDERRHETTAKRYAAGTPSLAGYLHEREKAFAPVQRPMAAYQANIR